MQSSAPTVQAYLSELPDDRREAIENLRALINQRLPKGFEEGMQYGMIGYYVPLSSYPKGYHCQPGTPLPFLSLASQKQSINLYHMGLYSNPELARWFQAEYKKVCGKAPDMGKSCIRFKNPKAIPFELVGELCSKMTPEEWIKCYEKAILRS